MSRLGYVHECRRLPLKRRLRATFRPRPCIQAEHGDIAAEARCFRNAGSIESLEYALAQRYVADFIPHAPIVWPRGFGSDRPVELRELQLEPAGAALGDP